jgi:SRSO17 transposase
MTPQEIAEVRPWLVAFAAGMLGGLPRRDQRAAGELYVRGLLTDGQRKSMQPMAERLGVDHQRLQQFITSSTWDYVAVRRNVARDFAGRCRVEALVVDDSGFAKDGTASPCVARQYSGTLGKTGNCQVGVSVHLVNERCSCAAGWRLFCPQSWDDHAAADEVTAAAIRRRRERAGIPDKVRHTEKWRLALEMIDEITTAGGWGVLDQITSGDGARPVAVAARATATTPPSGWNCRIGAGGTWSRSRAPPAPTPVMRSRWRGPGAAGPGARPSLPAPALR